VAGLLKPTDYPAQEGMPAAAMGRRQEALRLGEGVEGEDCRYGEDLYQRIALFVPPRPNGTVLAYMHGGGWTSGFKEVMAFMAPGFLEKGIVFASIGYRLAPKHLFPDQFDDVCRAMAWLQQNIADHGGNRDRIFVGGHSAGGHYAALLATRGDWHARHGILGKPLRGCLPVSGVFDLTATGGLSVRPRFLGPSDSGHDKPASPIQHLPQHPVPFLIAHGERDFPHLIRQAEEMESALRQRGGDVERIVFPRCDHFASSLATADRAQPWRERSVHWMSSH